MTEILTESFCERCGTRYTFETVQPKGRSLGALGTLGRGLRHFVLSSDSSFDESMAVARSESEQRTTTAQLEAFHRTFNFCLSCRQYTCAECWNAVEGRCLTCAPLPEAEALFTATVAAPPVVPSVDPRRVVPSIDVAPAAMPRAPLGLEPASAPQAEPQLEVVEQEVVAETVTPPEAALKPEAALAAPVAEPEAVAVEAEPVEAAREPEPEPTSIQLAPEPEAPVVQQAPEPVPEPQARVELELEPAAVAAEPEAVAAEPEAVAEPEASTQPQEADTAPPIEPTPASRPAAEPAIGRVALPEFLPGRSLDDEIAAYELRIAALAENPPEPLPPIVVAVTPQPAAVAEAQAHAQGAPLGLPSSPPAPAALGAAGSCRSCGLSISASARFCRRCGSAQVA